jgi:hypothetical protein
VIDALRTQWTTIHAPLCAMLQLHGMCDCGYHEMRAARAQAADLLEALTRVQGGKERV